MKLECVKQARQTEMKPSTMSLKAMSKENQRREAWILLPKIKQKLRAFNYSRIRIKINNNSQKIAKINKIREAICTI